MKSYLLIVSKLSYPLLAATLAFCGLGCDREEESGTSPTLSEEEFAMAYAQVVCETAAPCCEAEGLAVNETCVAQVTESVKAEASNFKLRYDASAGAACVNMWKSLAGRCELSEDAYPVQCKRAYRPTAQSGDPCFDDVECDAPLGSYANCERSVCVTTTVGDVGDACDGNLESDLDGDPNTIADCQPYNSHCAASGVCERNPGPGESCAESNYCSSDARCDFSTHTCVAVQPLGGDCAVPQDCQSHACENGKCVEYVVSFASPPACAAPSR